MVDIEVTSSGWCSNSCFETAFSCFLSMWSKGASVVVEAYRCRDVDNGQYVVNAKFAGRLGASERAVGGFVVRKARFEALLLPRERVKR